MGKVRNRKPIRSRRKTKVENPENDAAPKPETGEAGRETSGKTAGKSGGKSGGSASGPRVQYAALPYRRSENGGLEIMLLTSRETRRWVVPKGWPMKSRKPHAAAAREAYEEGGLVGEVARKPLGSYTYDKKLKSREIVTCRVDLFPFEVRRQLKRWPEKGQREGRWFTPEEAAEAVEEEDLGLLIRDAATRCAPGARR